MYCAACWLRWSKEKTMSIWEELLPRDLNKEKDYYLMFVSFNCLDNSMLDHIYNIGPSKVVMLVCVSSSALLFHCRMLISTPKGELVGLLPRTTLHPAATSPSPPLRPPAGVTSPSFLRCRGHAALQLCTACSLQCLELPHAHGSRRPSLPCFPCISVVASVNCMWEREEWWVTGP